MKKSLLLSMLTLAVAFAANSHASTWSSTVSGPFTQVFEITPGTLTGDSNQRSWFKFTVSAQASDFSPFSYTISGGDLSRSFSGTIEASDGLFNSGFLDKTDGVQNLSSAYTYTLTLTGNTLNSGAKAYALASNAMVTAVPEPESYAMLLAGLGVMATIARRRNRSTGV